MKKIFLFVICLLAFPISSKALDICSNEQYKQQIEQINNVDVSYTIQINNNVPTYTVTFKNLTEYMIIAYDNKSFTSSNGTYSYTTNNSGSVRYNIYSKACKTESKSNPFPYTYKSLVLPNYNKYYSTKECEEFKENYICQKWSTYSGNDETFKNDIKKLQDAKEKSKKDEVKEKVKVEKKWYEIVREIISKFWWAFIIIIFIITGIYYSIKSKQKKNEFDFRL